MSQTIDLSKIDWSIILAPNFQYIKSTWELHIQAVDFSIKLQ